VGASDNSFRSMGAAEDYVAALITPTLKPALVALCREKPADAVTFLAEWLLANKPPPPSVSVTDAFKSAAIEVFHLTDEDGSGDVTYEEVMAIVMSLDEAEAIMVHLDTDQDGVISEDEWVSFFMGLFNSNRDTAEFLLSRSAHMIFEREFMNMALALFHEFDKDQSGELELQEVLLAFGGDEEGKEFVEYCDQNGDKSISLQEWGEFFFGFWRYHPGRARQIVGFLMQRAGELQMMPALPPAPPA